MNADKEQNTKMYQTVSKFIIEVFEDEETKKNPEMVAAMSELLKTTHYF